MTWSRQLFQFVLCGHPTPRCWTFQEREPSSRVGLFRSQLRTLGTHYHPTLDPAVLWTPSNDTSRPVCSDSLNLMPPAPLYLRTLWRYTNAISIIIIIVVVCVSAATDIRSWQDADWSESVVARRHPAVSTGRRPSSPSCLRWSLGLQQGVGPVLRRTEDGSARSWRYVVL